MSFKREASKNVRPWYFTAVWAGTFPISALYGGIVYMALKQGNATPEVNYLVPVIFSILGLISTIAGVCMKKYLFSQSRSRRFFEKQEQLSTDHVPGLPPDKAALSRLIQVTFPRYVTSIGLVNNCAIFGMVLALITRNGLIFIPFLIIALIGTVLCYPKMKAFIEESTEA